MATSPIDLGSNRSSYPIPNMGDQSSGLGSDWVDDNPTEQSNLDSDWVDETPNAPPQLDLDLRRMTGSMNPNPPMVLPPEVGNIPQTFGQDAGNMVTQKLAEEIGSRGYPLTGAAVGTAAYMVPTIMQGVMTPELPIPKIFSKGARKVGKMFAGGIEKITGIPAENTAAAFSKPLSMFTAPTESKVSKAYAESELPDVVKGLDELIERGTGGTAQFVKRGSSELGKFVQSGKANARTILEARQALDKQIALLENQKNIARRGTTKPIQNAIDDKLNLRYAFNKALDDLSPDLRQADAMASERFKVAPFRDLTLPGKINLFSPEGIARSVPGLPTAVGAMVSGAGAATKLAKGAIKQSPRLLTASSKVLDESKAAEFLVRSGDDPEKARELAKAEGYSW